MRMASRQRGRRPFSLFNMQISIIDRSVIIRSQIASGTVRPVLKGYEVTLQTWRCLPQTIQLLTDFRNSHQDKLNDDALAGLNFSIIVDSFCMLEGLLESGLAFVWEKKHKHSSNTQEKKNIRHASSLDRYDKLFRELTGKSFPDMSKLAPLLEGLRMHFTLRNMLAHGRAVVFDFSHKNELPPNSWSEEFFRYESAFKKVESYLIKKRLLHHSIAEGARKYPYLSNPIADHFAVQSYEIYLAILASLDPNDADLFRSANGNDSQIRQLAHHLKNKSQKKVADRKRYEHRISRIIIEKVPNVDPWVDSKNLEYRTGHFTPSSHNEIPQQPYG